MVSLAPNWASHFNLPVELGDFSVRIAGFVIVPSEGGVRLTDFNVRETTHSAVSPLCRREACTAASPFRLIVVPVTHDPHISGDRNGARLLPGLLDEVAMSVNLGDRHVVTVPTRDWFDSEHELGHTRGMLDRLSSYRNWFLRSLLQWRLSPGDH